jgi:ribosomal protein S3
LNDMINALINSQKEIIGFRIKLKGRFNKWRRTKSVYINRGRLPLRIHDSKISYSSSYGCIRRGLFGVKIWICYDKHFSNKLESDLKNYLLYSKNKQIEKNVT